MCYRLYFTILKGYAFNAVKATYFKTTCGSVTCQKRLTFPNDSLKKYIWTNSCRVSWYKRRLIIFFKGLLCYVVGGLCMKFNPLYCKSGRRSSFEQMNQICPDASDLCQDDNYESTWHGMVWRVWKMMSIIYTALTHTTAIKTPTEGMTFRSMYTSRELKNVFHSVCYGVS